MGGDLVGTLVGSCVLAGFSHVSRVNYKSFEWLCYRMLPGIMGEAAVCLL